MTRKGLKIRFSTAGSAANPYEAASVTIPRTIWSKIDRVKDKQFEWKWHKDGILLVPIEQDETTEEVPAWATK